jgi:hypothetical protein
MVPLLQVSISGFYRKVTSHLRDCRANVAFVKENGKRRALHAGGNSSCRAHIRKHYPLYKERCKDLDIPENHYALPRDLWKKMQEEKKNPKAKQQGNLDGTFKAIKGPVDFTREGVLDAVARFVACDDQVRRVHRTDGRT